MSKTDAYRLKRVAEVGSLLLQTVREERISKESLQDNYRPSGL